MSRANNPRPPKTNRPTDPFGGPPRHGNTISTVVVLAALAFFLLLQWQSGALFTGNEAAPTAVTTSPPGSAEVDNQSSGTHETPTAALQPTATTPAAATGTPKPAGTQTPRATDLPTPTANAPPTQPSPAAGVTRASDLPTVAFSALPPEAQETIALIEAGGPFPYTRDGIVFQNRERILPDRPGGYYHEYTVITPGSSDRGARRIVTGADGEMYYTDDHYASFREIIR